MEKKLSDPELGEKAVINRITGTGTIEGEYWIAIACTCAHETVRKESGG